MGKAHTSNTPYMSVVDEPRRMKGGAVSTVFGVLGHAKADAPTRTLGGLIITDSHPRPSAGKDVRREKMLVSEHVQTERGTLHAASRTHVPGAHYGMVPYAGAYRSALGSKL